MPMEQISDAEKIERRNDFRLPVSLQCSIKRRADSEEDGCAGIDHDANMVDISSGGANILVSALLEQGEEISCTVTLGDYGRQDFVLTVRWIKPIVSAAAELFKTGLQFKSLSKDEEDAVAKYILSEQLIHLKVTR